MRHEIELTAVVSNPETDGEYFLESVNPMGGIRYPVAGLTLLYGRRFSKESFSRLSREARVKGDRLVAVKVMLQAERPESSPHWFDSFEGKSVFDLHRLRSDAESVLVRLWRQYMREDGYSEEQIRAVAWEQSKFISEYPEYIDRLKDEAQFSGIDAFIWRAREDGRVVARATLYRTDNVIDIKPVCVESIKVIMPVLQ